MRVLRAPGTFMASAHGRFQTIPLQQLEECSPSRAHIDWKTELSYRKVTSSLIYLTACGPNYLKLLNFTAARAVTLFNRFFLRVSFQSCDRWHIAPACILLASKIDNSPRTAKDVATAFFVARCDKKHKHLIHKVHDPAWVQGQVQLLVAAERSLMFALNFDFTVEIPESWILPAVRAMGLRVPQQGREPKDEAETAARDLVTNAYSLLATSYCKEAAILTVTHAADDVGKAALLTMCILCKHDLPLPPGTCFSEHFGASPDTLVAICERLARCFAAGTPGSELTPAQVRERATRRGPAVAAGGGGGGGAGAGGAAAAAGRAPEPAGDAAAAAAAKGNEEAQLAAAAAPPQAASSPVTAHDSASSHHITAGTALASRKRGCESDCEEGSLAKRQQQDAGACEGKPCPAPVAVAVDGSGHGGKHICV